MNLLIVYIQNLLSINISIFLASFVISSPDPIPAASDTTTVIMRTHKGGQVPAINIPATKMSAPDKTKLKCLPKANNILDAHS